VVPILLLPTPLAAVDEPIALDPSALSPLIIGTKLY
jgi:hypothetical protein